MADGFNYVYLRPSVYDGFVVARFTHLKPNEPTAVPVAGLSVSLSALRSMLAELEMRHTRALPDINPPTKWTTNYFVHVQYIPLLRELGLEVPEE